MPSIELIRPLELSPTGGSELTIENRGTTTVYYGRSSTVGPSNNIGTLKENEKLTLTKGFVWVVAESTEEELGGKRKQLPVILDLREKEIEPVGGGGGITVKEVEKIVKELAIGGGVKLGKPFEPEGTFKAKHAYEPSTEHDAIVYLSLEQQDEWKVSVDGVEVQHEKSELNSANVVPIVTVLVPAGSSWSVDSTVGEETIPRVVYQFIELTTGTLVPISPYITGETKTAEESFTPSTLNVTLVTVMVELYANVQTAIQATVRVNGEPAASFQVLTFPEIISMPLSVICAPGDTITVTQAPEEEVALKEYVCYFRELASAVTHSSQSVKIVDLGVIDFAKVFSEGPQTLYTLGAGEYLRAIEWLRIDLETFTVNPIYSAGGGFEICPGLGSRRSFGFCSFTNRDGVPADTTWQTVREQGRSPFDAKQSGQALAGVADGPIEVAWYSFWEGAVEGTDEGAVQGGEGQGFRVAGIVPWAPHVHHDAKGSGGMNPPFHVAVVANGTVWVNTGGAGESGAVEPAFAEHEAGEVADGANIIWQDTVKAPLTAGKMHAVAEIWTPS